MPDPHRYHEWIRDHREQDLHTPTFTKQGKEKHPKQGMGAEGPTQTQEQRDIALSVITWKYCFTEKPTEDNYKTRCSYFSESNIENTHTNTQ